LTLTWNGSYALSVDTKIDDLDDLELLFNLKFSQNFTDWEPTAAKQMKIDPYC